jgi:short-subunit dehydrogenase
MEKALMTPGRIKQKKLPEKGLSVLITGASSGLGRELAYQLAGQGARLLLSARNEKELESTRQKCLELGAQACLIRSADLCSPEELQQLWEWVESAGGVQALVNNAGVGVSGKFRDTDWNHEVGLVRLLIEAPLQLTKLWIRTRHHSGWLLNIASTGAYQPGTEIAVYYAAKAFMRSWSLALREELLPEGLVVTTAFPGALKTHFSQRMGRKEAWGARSAESCARLILRAWKKSRATVTPGFFEKVTVLASRLVPETLAAFFVGKIQEALRNR